MGRRPGPLGGRSESSACLLPVPRHMACWLNIKLTGRECVLPPAGARPALRGPTQELSALLTSVLGLSPLTAAPHSAHMSSTTRETLFLARNWQVPWGSVLPEPLGDGRALGGGLQAGALKQERLGLLGSKVRPCCGLQMGCPTRGKRGKPGPQILSLPSTLLHLPALASLTDVISTPLL